jgi:hypothetical protein
MTLRRAWPYFERDGNGWRAGTDTLGGIASRSIRSDDPHGNLSITPPDRLPDRFIAFIQEI